MMYKKILLLKGSKSKKFLLFFVFLVLTSGVTAKSVIQEVKDKVNELNLIKGKNKTSMVNDVIKRSSNQDITRVNEIIKSKAYQTRLNKYHDNAKKILGLDAPSDIPATSADEGDVIGDRLVLFVSSSMPIHVLRNYVNDVDKVGGVMIFKGTIGGIDSFIPTVNFLRQLMAVNPECSDANCDMRQINVSIDPERFSHHQIKRVPALIFEKNMKIQAYCKEEDKGPKAEIIAYGDASLAGLANVLFQYSQDQSIKVLLNSLRGIK